MEKCRFTNAKNLFFEEKIAIKKYQFLTDDGKFTEQHQVLDSDPGYYRKKFVVQ